MNPINRRTFLSQLTLATAALSLPQYTFAAPVKAEEFVEVEISHGKIRG